nr:hypothetical protein CFP56_01997 [Quercus suber]
MKRFFDNNPGLLLSPLTIDNDTAFHIAAYSEEKELLEHLVQLLPLSPSSLFEALKKTNKHGNNTFHEVATTNRVDTAEFLINKLQAASGADDVCGSSRLKALLEERTQLGETPLYRAAAFGGIDEGVKLNKGKEEVSFTSEVAGEGKIQTKPNERKYRCTPNEIRTPLLTAASEGIVEIFDNTIEAHPQAIEHLDKDEENILHVAVAHRQKEIYDRLKQMMVIRNCRLVSRINTNGYTVLHQVADMRYYQGDKAGPYFQ